MGEWVECDDGNECTEEQCVPGQGCAFEELDGPCQGPDPCQSYTCIDGECVGTEVDLDLHLDGIDEDCDGLTDEDVWLGLQLAADGFGSGFGKSAAGGMTLSGRFCAPPVSGGSSGAQLELVPGLPPGPQ